MSETSNGEASSNTFDPVADVIYQRNIGKGFYDREQHVVRDPILGDVEARIPNPSFASEKLMLIVTEVAEVMEALRDGDREAEAEEVADIMIRTLDYAAWRGFSMDLEVAAKMNKNHARPHLHGRKVF